MRPDQLREMHGIWVIVLEAIVLTACATVTAWKACHLNRYCRNSSKACSINVPHLHDFTGRRILSPCQ